MRTFTTTGVQSVDIDPSIVFPKARHAYEQGASLRGLVRRLHLTEGELRDVCPEEFADDVAPENLIGGY
jgi:hypothetical protein